MNGFNCKIQREKKKKNPDPLYNLNVKNIQKVQDSLIFR